MTQEEFHKRYQYNPNTDCLGEGGFGKVYKAYDTHRDRYVAIKMSEVKPHLEEVRLKKEVEIISKLPSHPNIAYYEECYTFSTFAGEYDFGVLQYYEKGNLQQLLTDKKLNYEQKDSILRQILEGIAFLHSQGIIHRDLKPQNILISNRNGKYIPKITDFGISKKLDANKSSIFTNSLAGAGTLSFASPEQLMGNTIRKNTDLWSFGVIAIWVLTSKLPFTTGTQAVTSEAGRIELYKQITSGDISSIIRQLSDAWSIIVKQCIVVDVEKRIRSADKCLEILSGKVIVEGIIKKVIDETQLQTIKTEVNTSSNLTNASRENTVKDIDGNVYNTVKIGNQEWMVEDLRTTRFRNGDLIGTTNSPTKNLLLTIKPKYQWPHDGDEKNVSKYGRLYTWYVAMDPRGIAPEGWRIPSVNDWLILQRFIEENGHKLFISQFKPIRGGHRFYSGTFPHRGNSGNWWTSTPYTEDNRWAKYVEYKGLFEIFSFPQLNNSSGFPVRCVRNVH